MTAMHLRSRLAISARSAPFTRLYSACLAQCGAALKGERKLRRVKSNMKSYVFFADQIKKLPFFLTHERTFLTFLEITHRSGLKDAMPLLTI
jgi:hypothetical protein